MKENKTREAISSFSGNINAAFTLIQNLNRGLDFDLGIYFDSSNSVQRFTNMVRNMIQKEIIEKPVKSGRSLILDERSILQLLVGRKYLASGCSMNALSGYLVGMTTEELYERLFTAQLPDIDKLARRSLSFSDLRDDTPMEPDEIDKKFEKKYPLYHYVKVKPDLYLHLKAGRYNEQELNDMVLLLKRFFEDSAKTEPY